MNNMKDCENNAKVSDSAYSTSCSNSQSRRSSKSTHSGSNSSGSSGYSGNPHTQPSEYSNDKNQEKRGKEQENKKKKKTLIELQSTEPEKENVWPLATVSEAPREDKDDGRPCPFALAISETAPDWLDLCGSDMFNGKEGGGFSCVMSWKDGVVVYAPPSVTTTLGYPKEMWIGRSFIDFLHPRDRNTFASQITSTLNKQKTNNAAQVKVAPDETISTIICRVRLFKGLSTGFGVKSRAVGFLPYMLQSFLKNITSDKGQDVYLVIIAIPFCSAFKTPNEVLAHPTPFIIKHSAIGNIEHIDIDAVRYLGYLPQEILEKDVLQLYHPGDLVQMRHTYENIVHNGIAKRSKPYRMITQNGHYLILESEWSSLVNPWSKRLEFIIGKHYILEGPSNPDVFQAPDMNNVLKLSDDEITITMALKQSIIRIMNENLTKPAQAIKHQIEKRNQDIASFVDRFIEDKPKSGEEIRVEIKDVDNNCFERDSEMLGGISPHHDDDDSKCSSETPLSYTQLNYNENMERFFNSHEPYHEYDYDSGGEHWKRKKLSDSDSKILSSMDSCSIDNLSDTSTLIRISSTNEDSNDSDYFRLTKYLLAKHNTDMEKELVKTTHHKNRTTSESEKQKALYDSLQNKMEHFARCNALYRPTNVELYSSEPQSQGVKKSSKNNERGNVNKQRCPDARAKRTESSPNVRPARTNRHFGVTPTWQGNTVNSGNGFVIGVPQPMSILSPIPMQGVIPVYFAPISHPAPAGNSGSNTNTLQFQTFINPNTQFFHGTHNQPSTSAGARSDAVRTGGNCHIQHPIPCMMIGQAIYNTPVIYPSIEPQIYAMQQNFVPQNNANVRNIGLSNRNYEEACKVTLPVKIGEIQLPELEGWKENIREICQNYPELSWDIRHSSVYTVDWATVRLSQNRFSRKTRRWESENTTTRTDGESNYSSFYSSFFKTESSSTTDDSDVRNKHRNSSRPFWRKKRRTDSDSQNLNTVQPNRVQPMEINTKEQVCPNSELIYKYQMVTRNMEEVIAADKKKLESFQQPLLVRQQLNQLYLDLKLQGLTARLTLEEGITSSSSSEEETVPKMNKVRRRRQRREKQVMIHEENAPLPSDESSSSSS